MNWNDIKPWVAKFAPTLGAALGPMGAVAGAIVGQALGVKDASPESIAEAVKNGTLGPDQIVALKKAEEEFALKMAELGYDNAEKIAELEFKDRDSARAREMTVRDWTPKALAVTYTVGFFAILGWMLRHGAPKDGGGEALLILLGALAAGSAQVLSYYFGSSSGSAHKDELLHQSIPAKGDK